MAISKKGEATREKILDAAQELILDRGFSGVSVDNVIESVGLTKGAYFHHFKNKNEMAVALIERYAANDLAFFYDSLARAEKLSSDPLQQMLILVGLYEELFAGMSDPYPGCLLASYIYELQMFDTEVVDSINEVFLKWRKILSKRFEVIAEKYPPKTELDIPALADEFTVLIEGAFILAKSLNDPKIVVQQLQQYKNYIRLIF